MHTTSVGPEVSLWGRVSDLSGALSVSPTLHLSAIGWVRLKVTLLPRSTPRMHWELLSSVQGQNAKAHLGANLLRIWDDGCFYDSEAYSVSNCVDLWRYPHKTSLVHFAVPS